MNDAVRNALRRHSQERGLKGRLLSEMRDGEEWAPRLFDAEGRKAPGFAAVPDPVKMPETLPLDRKATLFAFGGERANSTVFTAAITVEELRCPSRSP